MSSAVFSKSSTEVARRGAVQADHPAARALEEFRQMHPALRLHSHLAEDVVAALELAEKLVVEIVAVVVQSISKRPPFASRSASRR